MKINPAITIDNLGGKGYQLQRLSSVCDVPPFFVIKFDSYSEIKSKDIQRTIIAEFDRYKFGLVSVRSSATVEDGALASFAGIFESVLNVDRNDLVSAIEQVLNSIKNERVKQYCELKNIDFGRIEMRVVVQKMINADASGVCFTKTPNDTDNMTIEACFGLGEALVGGKVTPDNYIVNHKTQNIEKVSVGYQRTLLNQGGWVDVPFHQKNARKLTDDEIKALASVCLQIEKVLNFNAADIEWAFENGKLFILQAREVTG